MYGNKIQHLLRVSKKSVQDLADHEGVSIQAAYKWIHDQSIPSEKRLPSIASFFGISRHVLQFTPFLSLCGVQRQAVTLELAIAEPTVDLMIEADLVGEEERSSEFRLGMKHHLLSYFSDYKPTTSFSSGTCQLDAYLAGIERANQILKRQSN